MDKKIDKIRCNKLTRTHNKLYGNKYNKTKYKTRKTNKYKTSKNLFCPN